MLRNSSWSSKLPGAPPGKSSYDELILGVWRVLVAKDSSWSILDFQWDGLSTLPVTLSRVLHDVYAISPRLFMLSIIDHGWSAVEQPLALYLSNRLFLLVENRVSGGFAAGKTPSDLYIAVISKVACSALSAYMRQSSRRNRDAYASRVKYEFQSRLFAAKLGCDLQMAQEQGSSYVDVEDVYRCLEQGVRLVNEVISFLLHLHLIVHIVRNGLDHGGPIFIILCALPLFVGQFMPGDLWRRAYVASPENKFYIRKCALEKLAEADLRQEVMAGCIGDYLMNEYRHTKDGLGDTPDTMPELLYSNQHETFTNIIAALSSDGPDLYFALLALISPARLSITQLAVFNQTSTSLRYTFGSIRLSLGSWPGEISRMMNVYAALDIQNAMKDGETPFPPPGYEESAGMSIQIQDVSFSYPKTKSDRDALTSVSFTIQPGQLVVIVGANGSGKSTIIKLLSRFYEPTSGSIRIDGIPIEEYKMNELRRGIAMLTQEHQLFPLSVRENVKLGSSETDTMHDEKKIRASVSAAGASGLVENFSSGYDTMLEPAAMGYLSYAGNGNKELEAVQKNLDKPTSISGGEKQKLVAARTFMRLFTSPIKLVTVDEPSSALDPEAEYKLFSNLRLEQKGRTMIFVTHRFGHLTKHADLIICMKEGAVVETGTHADLLSREGEYARLYNVQAQAFTAI